MSVLAQTAKALEKLNKAWFLYYLSTGGVLFASIIASFFGDESIFAMLLMLAVAIPSIVLEVIAFFWKVKALKMAAPAHMDYTNAKWCVLAPAIMTTIVCIMILIPETKEAATAYTSNVFSGLLSLLAIYYIVKATSALLRETQAKWIETGRLSAVFFISYFVSLALRVSSFFHTLSVNATVVLDFFSLSAETVGLLAFRKYLKKSAAGLMDAAERSE